MWPNQTGHSLTDRSHSREHAYLPRQTNKARPCRPHEATCTRQLHACACAGRRTAGPRTSINGAVVAKPDEVEILAAEEVGGVSFYFIKAGRKKGFLKAAYVAE